jgi:hypothetical protein
VPEVTGTLLIRYDLVVEPVKALGGPTDLAKLRFSSIPKRVEDHVNFVRGPQENDQLGSRLRTGGVRALNRRLRNKFYPRGWKSGGKVFIFASQNLRVVQVDVFGEFLRAGRQIVAVGP